MWPGDCLRVMRTNTKQGTVVTTRRNRGHESGKELGRGGCVHVCVWMGGNMQRDTGEGSRTEEARKNYVGWGMEREREPGSWKQVSCSSLKPRTQTKRAARERAGENRWVEAPGNAWARRSGNQTAPAHSPPCTPNPGLSARMMRNPRPSNQLGRGGVCAWAHHPTARSGACPAGSSACSRIFCTF